MHRLDEKKTFVFSVNAFEVEAQYFETDIESIFIPLLKRLTAMKQEKNSRILVFVAAPPGVGKTTLSLLLQDLSKKDRDLEEVQAIGIDGFHFPQAYLEKTTIPIDGYEVLMKEVKGSPETFDFNQLKKKIMALKEEQTEIKWPIYDRKKHDVIPEQISIEKNIVVLEGNWLLLNEENWKDLSDYCDYSLFISAKEDLLRERLIERKMRGGLSEAEALNFYDRSDRKNIERVLNNKLEANLELEVSNNGKYSIGR